MEWKLVALAGALAMVSACDDAGDGKKPAPSDDAGTMGQDDAGGDGDGDAGGDGDGDGEVGTVQGRVVFANGEAVGQVEVAIGDKTYQTDSRGVFVASDVAKGTAQVKVQSDSTSDAQVTVAVEPDKSAQVDLAVLPLTTVEVAESDKAGTVTGTDGVIVVMEDKSLQTKDGADTTGVAEVRYGRVSASSDVKAAPGGLKALMADQPVQLETFGMVDLRFYQAGEKLKLAKAVDVTLPLGPNTFVNGDMIDVFSFDESDGYWKPEGKAMVENGTAKLKVPHLSWWCVGAPIAGTSCLSGKVATMDEPPVPLSGIAVSAVGVNYWGSSIAYSGDDGTFCLDVKEGSTSTVSAFGSNGVSYLEFKQDVAAGSAGMCGGEGCSDIGTLMGTSLFDECAGDVTTNQDHVLVLSSGDATLDMNLKTLLETHGHTVTVGVPFTMFDGTVDLAPYDAIYLQANYNWGTGDMPLVGQRQLINWVNCGGGLVTTEWTTWKIGSSAFQLIDAIFPAARTTAYGSPQTETFIKVTDDATLNAGLPDSFTFMTDNYSGTESNLNPRAGAAIYYDSMTLDSGLLGWQYNVGRVATFATCVGPNQVADANFSRLIANVVDWVQRD
jgi:hypothetical protein